MGSFKCCRIYGWVTESLRLFDATEDDPLLFIERLRDAVKHLEAGEMWSKEKGWHKP